jgi:hypothetical protein
MTRRIGEERTPPAEPDHTSGKISQAPGSISSFRRTRSPPLFACLPRLFNPVWCCCQFHQFHQFHGSAASHANKCNCLSTAHGSCCCSLAAVVCHMHAKHAKLPTPMLPGAAHAAACASRRLQTLVGTHTFKHEQEGHSSDLISARRAVRSARALTLSLPSSCSPTSPAASRRRPGCACSTAAAATSRPPSPRCP